MTVPRVYTLKEHAQGLGEENDNKDWKIVLLSSSARLCTAKVHAMLRKGAEPDGGSLARGSGARMLPLCHVPACNTHLIH